MAINVEWDNPEKTIICYHFEERWTWEEFFEARRHAQSIISGVTHNVGVIMNTPPNIVLPSNLLTHSLTSLRHRHPNTVIIVFIAGKSFLNMMISLMTKMSHLASDSMVMAANMDEARAIIAKRLRNIAEPTC